MGYSIVLQLKEKEMVEPIFELFDSNVKSDYIGFDTEDPLEGEKQYKNAIYISYGSIDYPERNLMYMLLYKIAETFGIHEKNILDNKFYPAFFYDDICNFVLTKEQKEAALDIINVYEFGFDTITNNGIETLLNVEGDVRTDEDMDNIKSYGFAIKEMPIYYKKDKEIHDIYIDAEKKADIIFDEFLNGLKTKIQ